MPLTRIIKPDHVVFGETDADWHPDLTTSSPTPRSADSRIIERDHCYFISPVHYRGRKYQVGLAKSLYGDGMRLTQHDWVNILDKSRWRLPSGPLLFATFTTLCQSEDPGNPCCADIRALFAEQTGPLMTGTRIHYMARKHDIVIHDWGRKDEYHTQGFLRPSVFDVQSYSQSLLGIENQQTVEDIAQYVSGHEPLLGLCALTTKGSRILGIGAGASESSWWYPRFLIEPGLTTSEKLPARVVTLRRLRSSDDKHL